ncbi:M56 family metallopeptidase [Glaciihabitans sp. dw_435]|uniref:M56 family metallopeptidase n=1 Tax=Glaciihabitans sp. dw_435 TaxID=2720081 RepID=UPI001BD44A6F|nr:M56 family metallopeptidase [Glaciihabitans sp. dw_435]
MFVASMLLAVLAGLLAIPVPVLLSQMSWPSRAPATALLLWQAIALSGGLSMIGSLVTFGLIPFGSNLVESGSALFDTVTAGTKVPSVDFIYVASLCAGLYLGLHLVANLILTVVTTERERRRHRQLVQLLSAPDPVRPHTRVIEHAVPVAYCLPGTQHSVTVFSAGLADLLNENELQAVIEHEKAHLLQRHYMVLLAFDAWRSSLPWFPIATRAQHEVGGLVEMLADDRARRTVDDRTLATAIALVANGTPAPATPAIANSMGTDLARQGAANKQLTARVRRLANGEPGLTSTARAAAAIIAVALIAVPTVLLFLPAFTA